ncbi:LysR substrate-binding domain-containing protein [Streptomyces sp. NPDC004096]
MGRGEAEPFVAVQPGFGLRRLMDEPCRAADGQPWIVFESTEIVSVESLAATDFGVAIVPSPLPNRADPEVARIPLRDGRAHRVIGSTWLKAGPLPPMSARFAEFVVSGRWDRRRPQPYVSDA